MGDRTATEQVRESHWAEGHYTEQDGQGIGLWDTAGL